MDSRTSSRTGNARTRNSRSSGPASDELRDDASPAYSDIPDPSTGSSDARQSQQRSSGIVDKMKERATTQLGTQKDRATEGLGTLAQAVRQTTERLREEQHDTVAQYVERAAEQLERLSDGLRAKNVDELLDDAQRFARSRPALFVGGSFVLGLMAARFLKSSRENETGDYAWQDRTSSTDYRTGPGGY